MGNSSLKTESGTIHVNVDVRELIDDIKAFHPEADEILIANRAQVRIGQALSKWQSVANVTFEVHIDPAPVSVSALPSPRSGGWKN